ncbi:MAG: hypothetical protein K8W52_43305, partial [Deltaproteobacteria bacterium]|nr:hypothetical protein [Deltaproteobacteria bacterium]
MTAAELLTELEPLTHAARMRRMVELGRQTDADAQATLAALAADDGVYPRFLALMSAYGSRDGAQVLARLDDPSRTIRHAACRLVAVVCDDAQAQDALERIVGKRLLRATIMRLVARRRLAPVEAFVRAQLSGAHDPMLVDLLPLLSPALVERERAVIEERGGPACWARLASRHPALYAAWIERSVAATGTVDVRQRWRAFPALPALADRAPDATLALVRRLFEVGEEPQPIAAALDRLLRRRPRETFDLIRARHEAGRPTRPPGAFGAVTFDRVAHALGGERLDYLVRHAPTRLGEGKRGLRWYFSLAPDDRAAVIRAFLDGGRDGTGAFLFRFIAIDGPDAAARDLAFQRWSREAQAADGTIAPDTLQWLPRDLREREARRHLDACAGLIDMPARRLAYAQLLAFAQAKEVLAPFLGHPEGAERARAQRFLIATLHHDRGAMTAVLDHIHARRFEQDPVRHAMLDALREIAIARFAPGDLERVGAIVQDALDAADLSAATAAAVEKLVARLFRLDGAWGATWLTRLFTVRGHVATWGLGLGLTRAEATRLAPAFAQLAQRWATQERAPAIIALAQSLGIRLPVVTPLLDALEALARELPFANVAAAALALIARHDRPRLATLVPALLAIDPSFVLLPTVAAYVSGRRQDLLAAILDRAPMTGRFATGRTHWVIDFQRGHGRWTERLQRRYAGSLAGLLENPDCDVPTARFALTALARLAYADGTHAIRFASDKRPPVREIAVRALPRLDAGAGVPVLIECLGDDRARHAIYALRRVLAEMRRERVLAALRAVPTTKVTVAKEVVRLLGELGGDDAYAELLALD